MEDDEQPIIAEVKRRMDIVGFTKTDRILQYVILLILALNFIMIVSLLFPWGSF